MRNILTKTVTQFQAWDEPIYKASNKSVSKVFHVVQDECVRQSESQHGCRPQPATFCLSNETLGGDRDRGYLLVAEGDGFGHLFSDEACEDGGD